MNFTELCVWILIKIIGQLLSPYFGKNIKICREVDYAQGVIEKFVWLFGNVFPRWNCFFFLHFGLHPFIKDNKNITCVQPCALMANLVAWSLKLADFLVTNNNSQKNKIQKRHCRAAKCQWVDSWRRCLHVVKTEIWCIEKNSKEQQVMWKKSQPTCEDLWKKWHYQLYQTTCANITHGAPVRLHQ